MVAVENTRVRPRPEDHTDYRAYLREMVTYLKASRPQFSYRYFSRIAGFTSPNFLKLVAEGQRNLTPDAFKLLLGRQYNRTVKPTGGRTGRYFSVDQHDPPLSTAAPHACQCRSGDGPCPADGEHLRTGLACDIDRLARS